MNVQDIDRRVTMAKNLGYAKAGLLGLLTLTLKGGISPTYAIVVQYWLVDPATGREVWRKGINTRPHVEWNEAFAGATRIIRAGVRTLSFGMMSLFLMVCFTHRFYPLAIQHLNKNRCAKNDLLDHP